jgi:hypothetical protein
VRDGIRAAIAEHGVGDWVAVGGEPPWPVTLVSEPQPGPGLPAKSLIQQEMLKRGILFNGSNFICLAHSDEDIDQTLDAYGAAFARLAEVAPDRIESALEAPALSPAFRQQT